MRKLLRIIIKQGQHHMHELLKALASYVAAQLWPAYRTDASSCLPYGLTVAKEQAIVT